MIGFFVHFVLNGIVRYDGNMGLDYRIDLI